MAGSRPQTGQLIAAPRSYELGLGPVMWVVTSEIFPLAARTHCIAFAGFSVWVMTVVVSVTFPFMLSFLGPAGCFFTFAVICVVSLIWVWVFVPETKGRSLEDIENLLDDRKQCLCL